MNHSLVVTSISEPTPILKALAEGTEKAGWKRYFIGDEKSDHCAWRGDLSFYSIGVQCETGLQSARATPANNYSRKNIGYLLAMRDGAEVIVETDDDNRPQPGFWFERRAGEVNVACADEQGDWYNAIHFFDATDSYAWPRGFPLDLIYHESGRFTPRTAVNCPIQQGLIAGDMDLDAVNRLVCGGGKAELHHFRASILALRNAWCPFNSQNTTWFKEAFPLMYIPSFCKNAYRMDDIWRSFIAQRIAFENGWSILWGGVTVVQERNPHDLMKDFEQEIPGYLYNRKIVEMLKALPIKPGADALTLLRNMDMCCIAMIEAGYIESRELGVLQAWYDDILSLRR